MKSVSLMTISFSIRRIIKVLRKNIYTWIRCETRADANPYTYVCSMRRKRLFYFCIFDTKDFVNIVLARRFDSWSLDRAEEEKRSFEILLRIIRYEDCLWIMRYFFADESLWKFAVSEKSSQKFDTIKAWLLIARSTINPKEFFQPLKNFAKFL